MISMLSGWVRNIKYFNKSEAENEVDSAYGSFKINDINESDLDFDVEISRNEK